MRFLFVLWLPPLLTKWDSHELTETFAHAFQLHFNEGKALLCQEYTFCHILILYLHATACNIAPRWHKCMANSGRSDFPFHWVSKNTDQFRWRLPGVERPCLFRRPWWGMKLCYRLKLHRGIDGIFAFSSGLCSWINEDSRICSRRQLSSLPMTSGLWKSTRWSGLACKSLQTDELSDVRSSSIRFIKSPCVCPMQEPLHEHVSL